MEPYPRLRWNGGRPPGGLEALTVATVVLIDDHEVGRAGRQALLEACGHRVRPATWSAIEALELHTRATST